MFHSNSVSQQERPTLPSLQEMLSDLQFDRLRDQPPVHGLHASNVLAGPFRQSRRSAEQPRRVHRRVFPVAHTSPLGSPTLSVLRQTPDASSRGTAGHSPNTRPPTSIGSANATQPLLTGQILIDYLPSHTSSAPHSPAIPVNGSLTGTSRVATSPQVLTTDLPTFIVPADELPPNDDRRHGCGICLHRFNRPSSLMIHMNSHTGAQPFECPFPGCTRRFSVNSNMRRHYRNHRDGAATTSAVTQIRPYPPPHYTMPDIRHPYYRTVSSPSSSSQSSFTDAEEKRTDTDTVVGIAFVNDCPEREQRTRSHSDVHPSTRDRVAMRPRACTVQGCNYDESPSALRAAFQLGRNSISREHR